MSERVKRYCLSEFAEPNTYPVGPGSYVATEDYDALHAEAEALRAEIEELDALRNRQSDLLSQTAIAVRGPEPALTRYSHADIPSRVKTVVAELEAARGLLLEAKRLRNAVNIYPGRTACAWADSRMDERIDAFLTATPAPEVRHALSAENQRVVPPGPIIAPPHPLDKPSLLKDCNVTYSNSSRPLAEQGERQEAVAWKVVGVHEKHRHPHVLVEHTLKLAEGQAAHWRNRGCSVEVIPLYTTPQPGPDVRGLVEAIAICEQEAAEWDSDAVVADKNYAAACAQRIHALAAHRQAQRQA